MGTKPRIPAELKLRPFTLQEAHALGLSRTSLRGRAWRHLGTELYCWAGLDENLWKLLCAWRELLPREAVFAGATAACLHGIDLDPAHPVEVIVPSSSGFRSRTGLSVRGTDTDEVVTVRRLRATTIMRTVADLYRRLSPVETLVVLDAAIRLGLVQKAALCSTGTRRIRSLAALAEPAESPMETRLRWLLLQGGGPRPEVQVDLHDGSGRFLGRADLYYPSARLVVEYDGGTHRDRMVEDNRRQNRIVNAGFRLLRFTAADVYARPDAVRAQVRAAIAC